MKVRTSVFGLILLSALAFNNCLAQKVSYTSREGLTIGLGSGASYQKSDLANSKGWGVDFTLGSPIYKKENAFLSVDWKFRFLAGVNKAYDHRINPDDTYSNIRYNFFTYDLEVGLILNRLRERTGIVISGFAGAGLTHGRTFTDLYNTGNNLYDYSGIDPNRDSKLVYEDLVALSDGDFETRLVSKASVLPTAGFFLGYQFAGAITIGVEYKTNFYLTEKNSFVGIDLDNRILNGSGLDRNNYVSAGLRWTLRGGSSYRRNTGDYYTGGTNYQTNTTVTGNQYVATSIPRPTVRITDPSADPYHTLSPTHNIRATITNVSGPDNISFYQNGYPNYNFTYNASTRTLVANVRLRDGENRIRITASNQTASAEDQVMITLDQPQVEVVPAPTVVFTSPSGTRANSASERIDVTASVKNISAKENIQLTMDGRRIPFDFYPVSGSVQFSVVLREGDNNLFIRGFNETGSAQDQLTVYFNTREELAPPDVRITNPLHSLEVNENQFPVRAVTQNVRSRNDVTVRINGSPSNSFSFGNDGTVSVNLFLARGVNTIEILARNEAGAASDATSITYISPVIISSPPPVITVIRPDAYPLRTSEPTEELQASVLNVRSKENITLSINGINTRDFSFNNGSKLLTTRVALRDGRNVVAIHAQNESGSDVKDQVFIKETDPCILPSIRLLEPSRGPVSTDRPTYAVRAEVRNVTNINQVRLLLNGNPVPFRFDNHILSSTVTLISGLNNLSLNARNECGEDNVTAGINYVPVVVDEPCTPPKVSFAVYEINRQDATHELRGSVSSVENKAGISLTLDGRANKEFLFNPQTGELNAKFKLAPGSHTMVVVVSNACGTDNQGTTVTVESPCTPPSVAFTVTEVNRQDATHELRGSVTGVKNKAGISLTLDGRPDNGFQFVPATGELSTKFKLTPGSHTVAVSANNECGSDSGSKTVTVEEKEEPCTPPSVAFTVTEVNRQDATHELRGSVTGVKNKAGISLTLDGRPDNGFQFVPATGELSTKFKLTPGSHTIAVTANNECGSDSETKTVTVQKEEEEKEEACGIRINPGNSDWQFCLITPSGRYTRANLSNSNFSYSGPASSLFFMPIGGGGNATVNGRPYAVRSGQYYLFTGSLNVTVSTKNPEAMGQWSVCITASRAPVSGNGNNRPKSPCEEVRNTPSRGNSNRR